MNKIINTLLLLLSMASAFGQNPGIQPSEITFGRKDGMALTMVVQPLHYLPVTDPEKRTDIDRNISPWYFVTADDAPTFVAHGDSDKLVPLSQSQKIIEKFKEVNVPCELKIKPGADHGFWNDMIDYTGMFADWFDKYL